MSSIVTKKDLEMLPNVSVLWGIPESGKHAEKPYYTRSPSDYWPMACSLVQWNRLPPQNAKHKYFKDRLTIFLKNIFKIVYSAKYDTQQRWYISD